MALQPVHKAATATKSNSASSNGGSAETGFNSELAQLMGQADPPDPGGGALATLAMSGVSNLGPNAQSNKTDLSSQLGKAGSKTTVKSSSASVDSTTLALAAMATNLPLPIPSLVGVKASGAQDAKVESVPTTPVQESTQANPKLTDAEALAVSSLKPGTKGSQPVVEPKASDPTQAKSTTNSPAPVSPDGDVKLQVSNLKIGVAPAAHSLNTVSNKAVAEVSGASKADGDTPTATAPGSGGGAQPDSGFSGGQSQDRDPAGNGGAPTATPDIASIGAATTSASPSVSTQASATVAATGGLSHGTRMDVVRQVSDHIELMAAAKPQQGVTVHLSPAGLGDVTVTVKSIGKDIEATLSATNENVRTALTDSKDSLNQAVAAKGFNLVGVTVASHSASTGNNGDRQPSQHQPQMNTNTNFNQSNSQGQGSLPRGNSSSLVTNGQSFSQEMEPETPTVSSPLDGIDYRI